jgi:hypothetical protein
VLCVYVLTVRLGNSSRRLGCSRLPLQTRCGSWRAVHVTTSGASLCQSTSSQVLGGGCAPVLCSMSFLLVFVVTGVSSAKLPEMRLSNCANARMAWHHFCPSVFVSVCSVRMCAWKQASSTLETGYRLAAPTHLTRPPHRAHTPLQQHAVPAQRAASRSRGGKLQPYEAADSSHGQTR